MTAAYQTGVDRLTPSEQRSLRDRILGRTDRTKTTPGMTSPCWCLPRGLGGRNGNAHRCVWVRSHANTSHYKEGKTQLAHRVVYEICVGPVGELQVLHQCDDGTCVNPDHLFLGTQAENVADMERKGRAFHPVGEHNGQSKINPDVVRDIRSLHKDKIGTRTIAKRLGTTRAIVLGVVHGVTWKWVE